MQTFTDISAVNLPALPEGQYYIYVIENSPQGNIKIGRTGNIQQRLSSLSGSNSGGNHITKIAVSDATYLYTLEHLAHIHFGQHRIDGTEWFEIAFEEAVHYVSSLFKKKDYELCNKVRSKFNKEKKNA